MPRKKEDRQRAILVELEGQPTLRVGDLARRLDVSAETIRRDLDDLTTRGLVARTYGGAMRRLSLEPSVEERHGLKVREREAIARAAVPLLHGARHIMIGSGATTVHVARRIAADCEGLTVITHSFAVAAVLSSNPSLTVIVCPGVYHGGEGATMGADTLQFLNGYRADWAILGASGLTDEGPCDALLESGSVYAAMLRRAAQTMIVADSGKFDRSFPACWATWDEIDTLVSDQAAPPHLIAAAAGLHTVHADWPERVA